MSLFGAALVTGERGHMNIPILVEKSKPAVQKVLGIFAEIIACIFAIVILVYGGVQITSLAMGQLTTSLGVPIGVFYVVMPVCGVLIALYTIINIIELATGKMGATVDDEVAQAIKHVEQEKAKEAQQYYGNSGIIDHFSCYGSAARYWRANFLRNCNCIFISNFTDGTIRCISFNSSSENIRWYEQILSDSDSILHPGR